MLQREQNDLNELITAAASGNQPAFEALLNQYAPLLDSMSAAFAQDMCDKANLEDWHQEACIAFYNAVKKFDVSQKEVQFGLYAKICIRNHLISCLRASHAQELSVPPEALARCNSAVDPGASLVEQENYLALARQIKEVLTPYENRVWWLYLAGHSASEIAEKLQKDERSVQNAIYRSRKKLHDALAP